MTQGPNNPADVQTETGVPGSGTQGRSSGPSRRSGKSELREWVETLVFALLIALGVRTFVVQVYMVEGQSMAPSLHTSQRLLVNRFIYRFRSPHPGEIIVLKDPGQPTRELIKRVVAVAGDKIQMKNGVTYVNEKALSEPFITPYSTPEAANYGPWTVPKEHVFVMGDNRPNSQDSRALGPIPLENIDGKAFFLFWPLQDLFKVQLDQPIVPRP